MNGTTLAQLVMPNTLVGWALAIVILAGIAGIVIIVVRQTGVTIPPFIVNVLWVLLAVVIGVFAIKLIAGMF